RSLTKASPGGNALRHDPEPGRSPGDRLRSRLASAPAPQGRWRIRTACPAVKAPLRTGRAGAGHRLAVPPGRAAARGKAPAGLPEDDPSPARRWHKTTNIDPR